MKKLLWIPTIVATITAPIAISTSCTVHMKPTPPGPTPTETYEFNFSGNHCTINGQKNYSDEIEQGKQNVKFTVVPDPGYIFTQQTLPPGVEFDLQNKVGIVTIANMNHDYSVSIDTEQQIVDAPLTFTITNDCYFYVYHEGHGFVPWSTPNLQYSINDGDWIDYDMSEVPEIKFFAGQKIQFRGNNPGGFSYKDSDDSSFYNLFVYSDDETKPCGTVSGNIMSLISYNFDGLTEIPSYGCFYNLFWECSFSSAANLILPSDRLTPFCYQEMFYEDAFLADSPVLPATNLSEGCYAGMFSECNNLIYSPELPASKLVESCYASMFSGCNNLVSTPELPSMQLANRCYNQMFSDCISLTSAPALPAEHLTHGCYEDMFRGCRSLMIGHYGYGESNLIFTCPDTSYLEDAVDNMFGETNGPFMGTPHDGRSYYWLTSLESQPLTFTATDNCVFGVFYSNEAGTWTIPNLQYSIDGGEWTNYTISQGYPQLIDISAHQEIQFRGDNPNGFNYINYDEEILSASIFLFLDPEYTGHPCGKISGNVMSLISPDNFESITEIPCDGCFGGLFYFPIVPNGIFDASDLLLPCDQLKPYCYDHMFCQNANLVLPPELPATELSDGCYQYMFNWCENLIFAPKLPAEELADGCYADMFSYCWSLAYAPQMLAEELADGCCESMFAYCGELVSAPKLPAEELANRCYKSMFEGCESLVISEEVPNDDSQYLVFTCPDTDGFDNPVTDMFDGISEESSLLSPTPTAFNSYFCYSTGILKPLTFTATEYCTFSVYHDNEDEDEEWDTPNLWYSINDEEPEEYIIPDEGEGGEIDLGPGDQIQLIGDNQDGFSHYDYDDEYYSVCNIKFYSYDNGPCGELSGNVMSLISPNFDGLTEIPCAGCFDRLFYESDISGASNLTLPARVLTEGCYSWMFNQCWYLTSAPALPATQLASNCYYQMFQACEDLKVREVPPNYNDEEGFIFTCIDPGQCYEMFDETAGTFDKGTPNEDYSYYWYY